MKRNQGWVQGEKPKAAQKTSKPSIHNPKFSYSDACVNQSKIYKDLDILNYKFGKNT